MPARWIKRLSVRTVAPAIALTLVGGVALTAASAQASTSSITCYTTALQNNGNDLYVSAEIGYTGGDYGMLRARAKAIGQWEKYTMCRDADTGMTTFQSWANGKYVSAELGYSGADNGMLRARADSVGSWEKFYTVCDPAACNRAFYIESEANHKLVSAELGYPFGYYGMLRARANQQLDWEGWAAYDLDS